MKRLLPICVLAAAGLAAMAQTCIITNESFNRIGTHDTFAGEIQNDSGVNILYHRIRVAFLDDSDNSIVQTVTVDGCLRSLQNGASDFFSAASSEAAAETDFAIGRMANIAEDPDFEVGTTAAGDIAISGVTATLTGTELTVTGTITNNDADTLDEPAACVVLYDDDGNVVVTGKDATLEDLDEDESDTFSAMMNVPDDVDFDHVDVWADGLEDGTAVDPEVSDDHSISAGTATATPTVTTTPTPTNTPGP
ncbi:MAG: hypothetical protein HY873_12860 [Chloroflexi bacterium]|nr:hypothetical protein [Chloroflexota bacterium]